MPSIFSILLSVLAIIVLFFPIYYVVLSLQIGASFTHFMMTLLKSSLENEELLLPAFFLPFNSLRKLLKGMSGAQKFGSQITMEKIQGK